MVEPIIHCEMMMIQSYFLFQIKTMPVEQILDVVIDLYQKMHDILEQEYMIALNQQIYHIQQQISQNNLSDKDKKRLIDIWSELQLFFDLNEKNDRYHVIELHPTYCF